MCEDIRSRITYDGISSFFFVCVNDELFIDPTTSYVRVRSGS